MSKKTQLYYKGKYQPHGLVSVDVLSVEKLLQTEDFCLPGEEDNERNRSNRSERSTKKSAK